MSGDFDATLVSLYDCKRLLNLAHDKSASGRADLARSLTSFFDLKLESNERELASEVLLSLLKQAECDIRKAVAERLSTNDTVPLRVILELANDEIEVAHSVLQHSPVLNEMDLMFIIMSKTAEYWAAIAMRRDLTDALISSLAAKREAKTAHALLNNEHIVLQKSSLETFVDLARSAFELNIPLIHRPELPADLAEKIYNEVGEELRALIHKRYKDEPFIKNVDLSLDASLDAIKGAIQTNNAYHEARKPEPPITANKLLEAMRMGYITQFKILFSAYSGLNISVVESLMAQRGGRGFVIACKAKKMSRNDFMKLFMLKSSATNANKLVDQGELALAMATFDKMDLDAARDTLAKVISNQADFTAH